MIVYRILENGYYGGPIELPDDLAGMPYGSTRKAPPELQEGQYAFWGGTDWIAITNPPLDPAPAKYVPESITKYQAKMALLEVGLFAQVDEYVNLSEDLSLKIAWYDAETFHRRNQFITSIGQQFSLTEEQIDDLFILALNY